MYIDELYIFYFAIVKNHFLAIIDTCIRYTSAQWLTQKNVYAAKCKG